MANICCFAGHSEIYGERDIISENLYKIAKNLIINKNVSEFWTGNYGAFDGISAHVVRELKKEFPDIQINLVIPYLTKDINEYKEQYYKNYDNIIMAEIPEKTPNSCQILKCNQYMVNCSKFLICYVKHSWGGAAKTLEFAQKQKHIKIYNLAGIKMF